MCQGVVLHYLKTQSLRRNPTWEDRRHTAPYALARGAKDRKLRFHCRDTTCKCVSTEATPTAGLITWHAATPR